MNVTVTCYDLKVSFIIRFMSIASFDISSVLCIMHTVIFGHLDPIR